MKFKILLLAVFFTYASVHGPDTLYAYTSEYPQTTTEQITDLETLFVFLQKDSSTAESLPSPRLPFLSKGQLFKVRLIFFNQEIHTDWSNRQFIFVSAQIPRIILLQYRSQLLLHNSDKSITAWNNLFVVPSTATYWLQFIFLGCFEAESTVPLRL